jgi:hypothetical protein
MATKVKEVVSRNRTKIMVGGIVVLATTLLGEAITGIVKEHRENLRQDVAYARALNESPTCMLLRKEGYIVVSNKAESLEADEFLSNKRKECEKDGKPTISYEYVFRGRHVTAAKCTPI